MYIENKSIKYKSKIIQKIIKNFINELPLEIKNILNKYETKITITNIRSELNYQSEYPGCYLMEFDNNKPIAHIYISEKNNISDIKNILSHEIGHLLDQVLGCFYNNVNVSSENIRLYPLSLTHEEIRFFIKKESDFFSYRKESVTEIDFILEKYDLQEEFANCVAQVLTSKSKSKFPVTKNTIAEVFNEFNAKYFNVFKTPVVIL